MYAQIVTKNCAYMLILLTKYVHVCAFFSMRMYAQDAHWLRTLLITTDEWTDDRTDEGKTNRRICIRTDKWKTVITLK